MNQKEALAKGFVFGSSNAQKVLKAVRDHVIWSEELSDDERQALDRALLVLDELGSRGRARWDERCRRLAEENRRRNEERLHRRVAWLTTLDTPQ